jgi:hypothetical protein
MQLSKISTTYTKQRIYLILERSQERESEAMMSEQLIADSFPLFAILDKISRSVEMVVLLGLAGYGLRSCSRRRIIAALKVK